ncbi:hypothetical protein WDZ92_46225, partial [Nostoc sp. NIES-2111]
AVALGRVDQLRGRVVSCVGGAIATRGPGFAVSGTPGPSAAPGARAAAPGSPAAPAPVAVGPIGSPRDAALALGAVAEYFATREPSSPSLLLVRQAEQLIGKSFLEVMQVLLPGQIDQANVQIGGQEFFDFPLERLGSFDGAASGGGYGEEEPSSWQDDDSGGGGDEYQSAPADDDAEASGDGAGTGGDETEPASEPEEAPPAPAPMRAPAPVKPVVQSRQAAMAVLQQVGTYFRVAEPSSPIPFLTDRARSFAERDFLSLLKDVLPESSLKKIGGQD